MTNINTPRTRLKALQDDLLAMKAKAEAEHRDFTAAEQQTIETKAAEALELKGKIERSNEAAELLAKVGGTVIDEPTNEGGGTPGLARPKAFMALSGDGARRAASLLAAKVGTNPAVKALAAITPIPLSTESPFELGRVPASVLDVLPLTQHTSPTYRYPRQTQRTNNAAVVAPGGTKPTSTVDTEMVDVELKVIATMSQPVDEYALKDASVLDRFLAAELQYMLLQAVEEEVLNGDGTGSHMTGILATENIQTQAFDTDSVTTLRMAALKAENAGHQASVFVVNPQDWATIETTRNLSGNFDLGTAIDRAAQKLWGVPVVTSGRIAVGEAVSLDLGTVGLDADMFGLQVKWFDVNGGETNQVRARVEGRFGVSVYQPLGVVKASLTEA